jgi:hypothetical protein
MSASILAQALSAHGIHVDTACDGDDNCDGDITVATMVHVQVPSFGEPPRVIVDTLHMDLRCYPPRRCIAELASDIREAMSELPAAAANCSIH